MADVRISDLTAHSTGVIGDDDLIEVSEYSGGVYTSRKITGAELKASSKVPARYKATLTQTSTNDPVETVLENDLGAIVWTRTAGGTYRGTLTGAFIEDLTFLSIQMTSDTSLAFIERLSNDVIQVVTTNGALAKNDDLLRATAVLIEVYPTFIS